MVEIWKDIDGFEGLYKISNLGNIYSIGGRVMGGMNNRYKNKPRMMKPHIRNGYEHVCLTKDKKQFHYKIHRLVAMAFVPNPNDYPFVNHKNEIKDDNRAVNLEWCTAKYNLNYGSHNEKMRKTKSKKPIAQFDMNGNFIEIHDSSRDIERKFGYFHNNITNCCKHKYGYKSAYGYKWEFATRDLMEEYNLIEKPQ